MRRASTGWPINEGAQEDCVIINLSVLPSDTAYVRIFITDVNDNAPAFAQPVYEVSVEEDKEVGFVLITVTANDEDEGESRRTEFIFSVIP